MSLKSLIRTGTKVWLDGVEPDQIKNNRALGITGATSNPTIISQIIEKGTFDRRIVELIGQGLNDNAIAWTLDDALVRSAQEVFLPVWEQTRADDGYVSFELDPLIEDQEQPLSHAERVRRYVDLGKQWSAGHRNRMIKVPATAAGLGALEELAAAGVTINVTLMFTERQYRAARDAIWRGAAQAAGTERLQERL
jgi:transaldolase